MTRNSPPSGRVDELPDLRARQVAGGDQHFFNPMPLDQSRQIVAGANHRHAADPTTLHVAAIVDEADDAVVQRRIRANRSEQRFAGIVRSDDQRRHAAR